MSWTNDINDLNRINRTQLNLSGGLSSEIDLITVLKASLMGRQTRLEITVFVGNPGRFPFDQKFRNEISSIPCDEWNSIFRLV